MISILFSLVPWLTEQPRYKALSGDDYHMFARRLFPFPNGWIEGN